MFGYIRPFKPYMRHYEYEIYSSFYCGLCKILGKKYGQIFRLMLSYDFTFLGLLYNAYHSKCNQVRKKRCIIHPFKKKSCICCTENLDYTSAAAVISVYHKICDEISDRKFFTALFFRIIRKFIKKAYKKAAAQYPIIAEKTEYYMNMQRKIEAEKCTSIDCACDPTAQIMSVIAENISSDENDRKNLAGFGYQLGRFIYLADAYEDMTKDKKNGNYNPLLLNFDNIDTAGAYAIESINMSLGQAAEYYSKINFGKYREILDNVVYLGLPKFNIINNKEYRKNKTVNI